jgi:hypothetical protein
MNYQRHYDLLIAKAQSKTDMRGYFEKHHIIPKSLGGSNAKNNIVKLTGREHFVAHILLAKIHGKGLWQAAVMMKIKSAVQPGRVGNSRLYEMARKGWAEYASTQKRPPHVGEAIRKARTGSKASEEAKAKMSAARKGKPRSGDPSKWKHSNEAKAKMSEAHKAINTGSRLPRFYGEDNPMKQPENRAKISAAKKAYWAKVREQKLLSTGENHGN